MKFLSNKTSDINKNVWVLSIVSFLNDTASEMVYPIIPIFLTSVLGAPVSVVGFIEGLAEATSSVLKVFSGWFSDKIQKRKPLIVAGYSFSAVSKLLLGLAVSWPMVLLARFTDKFGKGTRTTARDALLAENSRSDNRGRIFGFHRAMDTLGAVVGPLIAILLLHYLGNNFKLIFLIAFIAPAIGVLLLVIYIKEKRQSSDLSTAIPFSLKNLNPAFITFLIISGIFALGNSADAFLILRAKDLGLSVIFTILAYVSFNVTYSLFSLPAGTIADKIGKTKVFISGLVVFALVYLGFGLIQNSIFLWLLFPAYGIYMAFTDGVGKAYIANLIPHEQLGTAYGVYQIILGVGAFLSSLIAGLMWTHISISSPFYFGAAMASIAAVTFIIFTKQNEITPGQRPEVSASL